MVSDPYNSSLFLVLMLLCYYFSPNNDVTAHIEGADDWLDSHRCWNGMCPYHDSSDVFEVCHRVEDVCRIEEIEGLVYDPHKYRYDNTTSNNLEPRPVIANLNGEKKYTIEVRNF